AIIESGLVASHIQKFKEITRLNDIYVLFRPVNKLSTALIENGAATKGLNVHGKSSDWGPMAGYIPFDQDLSKKYGKREAVEKGNKDNMESIHDNDGSNGKDEIIKMPLIIDTNRINELQSSSSNIIKGVKEYRENNTTYLVPILDNTTYEFRINKNTNEVQYRTKEGEKSTLGIEIKLWKAVEVMGKVVNGVSKPLTADYDLFALAPNLEKIRQIIPNEQLDKISSMKPIDKLRETTKLLIKHGLKRENKNDGKGVLSHWQREIIIKLNESAKKGGYTGGNVINHGTEQDNTDYPEKDETIFIVSPKGETVLIIGWEDVQKFIRKNIIEKGYLFYHNRSYNIIAPGSKSQISWNDYIPTSLEFVQELALIRKATNNINISNKDALSKIQMLTKLLEQYYYPAKQFQEQDPSYYEVSLFRGIQALEVVDQLLIGKGLSNKEYENYFKMLRNRIMNQLELTLKKQKIKVDINEIRKKLNFNNKQENILFGQFKTLLNSEKINK
ncbi:TPA: calmodulin-sensitive adenylate cyclase, partial [Bacillus cereus]|nr:calmodulin-sensitive adenylate cyclase [Bacillus cereus]